MKIVILSGSPHKKGTSAYLVERFMEGARESGHEIFLFETAFKKIHPCIACDKCGCGDHPCVFQDDMAELWPKLEEADFILFATPLYYYSATSQLLAAVARFYAIDKRLKGSEKKAALIATGTNPASWAMEGIVKSYREALAYLEWQDCGTVLAKGCKDKAAIAKTAFPEQAYQLGKTIGKVGTV